MFHGFSISAIIYADDLVVLSPSIYELQLMVNVCCNELNSLDLLINLDKSASLRIGKGCNKIFLNIQAMENNINWVTEAKYLGLYIRSWQKFTCNFDKQKSKFYRSTNCIFAKLGKLNPPVNNNNNNYGFKVHFGVERRHRGPHTCYPTPRALHCTANTCICTRSTSFDQNSNLFSGTS